jgi:hypothetical protein
MMLGEKQIRNQETTPYATGGDFCRIFKDDMNGLYLLAFLLTANESLAEQCFIGGLEDSQEGNPVFQEWARSWARRMIIQKAIHVLRPRPEGNGEANAWPSRSGVQATTDPVEVAAVVALPSFERFVFVMSVLEHYSDQECSLLLGSTRRDEIVARTRALQRIASYAQLRQKVMQIHSQSHSRPENAGPGRSPAVLHFAPAS